MMKRKKIILGLATFLILLTIGLGVYLLIPKNSSMLSPLSLSPANNVSHFSPPPAVSGEYNVLLLGLGGSGHPGGILTDSMTLAHLNTNTKTASLVFIPRDLWVNNMKINEAYSKGGLETAKQAVQIVTGLAIQYGLVIDFNQFTQMIDSLGGIDINVTKTFDDYFYPVPGRELEICGKSPDEVAKLSATMSGFQLEREFPCRYEHIHFDAGKNHVSGALALKFARSRHSAQDADDFGRGARQQVVLLGLKDKLLSIEVLSNVEKFFKSLSKFVQTDLDLATAKTVAALIVSPQDYKISQIVPSTTNILTSSRGPGGQSILIPKAGNGNWQEFKDFVTR